MSRTRLLALCALACLLALAGGLLFAHSSTAAATAPRAELPPRPQRAVLGLEAVTSADTATTTVQRTFVSTAGSDANPCTNALPCRGFAAAMANTSPGGEVVALTSGGYGPVGIGMAVTIIGAPGVHAAITALTGNAIEVNAGVDDTVVLRNLYLNGLGGENGIVYNSGYALMLEQITATGFTGGAGVFHQAPNGRLHATDLIVRRNANGVYVFPNSGIAPVSLDRVQARENTSVGVFALGNARLRISDSVVSGNASGIFAEVPTMVSGCQLSENVFGLYVLESVGRISGSTVTSNQHGLWNDTGTLESFGDNVVRGNTIDNTVGTVTTVATS
jgi:copper-binding protein NosD